MILAYTKGKTMEEEGTWGKEELCNLCPKVKQVI